MEKRIKITYEKYMFLFLCIILAMSVDGTILL